MSSYYYVRPAIQRSLCFHLGDEDGKPLEAGCAAPTSSASFDVSNTSFGIQKFPVGSKVAPRANTAALIGEQVNKENQTKHHPKPMVVTNPKCLPLVVSPIVELGWIKPSCTPVLLSNTVEKLNEYTGKKKDLTRRNL